jgi:hypothetical protein
MKRVVLIVVALGAIFPLGGALACVLPGADCSKAEYCCGEPDYVCELGRTCVLATNCAHTGESCESKSCCTGRCSPGPQGYAVCGGGLDLSELKRVLSIHDDNLN